MKSQQILKVTGIFKKKEQSPPESLLKILSWEEKLEAGPCLGSFLLLFSLQFTYIHGENYARNLVSE